MRRIFTGVVAALISGSVWAQTYPNKPVRVVVAAATGGPDIVARIVSAELTNQLGQSFFVENQPGANGIVGANTVAKAAPDGYTLLVYSAGFVINPYVQKQLPYDTEKDFAPVTNLTSSGGLFLAVNASVPATNLPQFIEHAKKNSLAYSTPGVGNNWHLATEVFSQMAGIKMTHVPYKGATLAAGALVSGEVDEVILAVAPALPFIKSGRVRPLAVLSEKRVKTLPDVPTSAEAGLPAFRKKPFNERWRLWFLVGIPLGGASAAALASALTPHTSLALLTGTKVPGLLVLFAGGFLVGYGARLTGG